MSPYTTLMKIVIAPFADARTTVNWVIAPIQQITNDIPQSRDDEKSRKQDKTKDASAKSKDKIVEIHFSDH